MAKDCYSCSKFPNCSMLNKMLIGEDDELEKMIIAEYGKHCEEYLRT